MPQTRVTIASNAQQTQRCAAVLPLADSTAYSLILEHARRKLRLKKPSRIFLPGGLELIDGESIMKHVENDTLLLISCGEEYVGARSDPSTLTASPYRIIANSTYIDPEAIKQLRATASLAGIVYAAGMPDLHPGNRFPVGAAFLSRKKIYPPLIGGDIGCGMALWATPLIADTDPARLADKMRGLEGPWTEGDPSAFLSARGVEPTVFDASSLGTVGGGNHFAELQALESVHDAEACAALGLLQDRLHLLVHTGSRGLGQAVLHAQPLSIDVGTPEHIHYMKEHDHACSWASSNRALVARRVFSRLCPSSDLDTISPLFEITHNAVVPHTTTTSDALSMGLKEEDAGQTWIHRKGAAPSLGRNEPLIIPGSRGARTYILISTGSQASNAYSVAHGAGRSIPRFVALSKRPSSPSRLAHAMKAASENGLGGRVVCENTDLVFEEAPECYKDVDCVVEDLVNEGMVRVVGVMKPVVTYKMRIE